MELTKKLLFLESFLGKSRFNPNKKEATFSCVFCNHHKEKLSINLEQDRWQCWVCGKKGRTLVPILKQSGSSHLIKEYLECFKAHSVKEQEEEIVYRPLLPKSFQPLCDSKGSFFEQAALS